jgi:RNA polymerase sigma-70 factor (sigma-E family)
MDPDLTRDFTAFVEARTPALFRTAVALTGNRTAAEDLLQSVLARTFLRWADVRRGHPEAYVRRAMYLDCVSRWRRRSYRLEVVTDRPPEHAVADGTEQVDLRLALLTALGRLGPKQRAIVVLRYLEDLSDAQIAEIVGNTPGTVRGQLTRALDRLRVLCPELNHRLPKERVR